MSLFESIKIGPCELKNKIVRSATFEGMCDGKGIPLQEYRDLYKKLAQNKVGAIITGFSFVSSEGKAMQPGQAGLDQKEKLKYYIPIVEEVHSYGSKIFMQIAHTGRQTRQEDTKEEVVGVSKKKSIYFKSDPRVLSTKEIYALVEKFADAAFFAKEAGFDGVQLHAAHGYLIHQFIHPSINNRKDEFKIDPSLKIGTYFLELVIDEIRKRCGTSFSLWIKVSGGDDFFHGFTMKQFENLIVFLDSKKIDAIEISYGTMDYALNIFRGKVPLKTIFKHNPIFQKQNALSKKIASFFSLAFIRMKIKGFTPMYNLVYAKKAKQWTRIPIISVGGFRKKEEMEECLEKGYTDLVGLCRPFLCEPDFINQIEREENYVSKCTNCNICAVMCDSKKTTKCYRRI